MKKLDEQEKVKELEERKKVKELYEVKRDRRKKEEALLHFERTSDSKFFKE